MPLSVTVIARCVDGRDIVVYVDVDALKVDEGEILYVLIMYIVMPSGIYRERASGREVFIFDNEWADLPAIRKQVVV